MANKKDNISNSFGTTIRQFLQGSKRKLNSISGNNLETDDSCLQIHLLNVNPDVHNSNDRSFGLTESTINHSTTTFRSIESSSSQQHSSSIPLYEGSRRSEEESKLLLFGFMARHGITRDGCSELLELVSFFLPKGASMPTTNYQFQKMFVNDKNIASQHYYCDLCENNLGTDINSTAECQNCGKKTGREVLTKSGHYFVLLDIRSQLESLLSDPDIANEIHGNLTRRTNVPSDTFNDIMDGLCYKSLQLSGFDLSCTLNTGGVPVFKSSKFSLWPIIVSINELSYRTRYKTNFLGALWFGSKKPNFDTFFTPFVTMCGELVKNCLNWNFQNMNICSRVYFPIMVNDSVARCLCQGLTQFNGAFGCTWCLTKGEYMNTGDRSGKWVYGPLKTGTLKDRTHANIIKHIQEFSNLLTERPNLKSKFGVKSASKLLLLPKFNIVNGFTFDVMHTCFLGISRAFLNNWINSQSHQQPFYIGKHLKRIDERLLKCLVPFSFDRTIRSVEHRKFWKASEWRTWMLVCGWVLKDILPSAYLAHFLQFVEAVVILCGENVSTFQIERAYKLCLTFSNNVHQLYGLEFCSYNCHILIHASQCVKNWGPLWCYSAFQFENFNGVLLNLFNGTSKVEIQICNRLNQMFAALKKCRTLETTPAKRYFLTITRNLRLRKNVVALDNVLYFGPYKLYYFDNRELKALTELSIHCGYGRAYKKCFVNNLMFSTSSENTSKRCNSIAEINGSIYLIKRLVLTEPCKGICLVAKLKVKQSANNTFSYAVSAISEQLSVFPLHSMKGSFISCTDSIKKIVHVMRLPNNMDFE